MVRPDAGVEFVDRMNIDFDVVAEDATLVAIFGNAVDAGERIRRDCGTEPADGITVIAVMRRLYQHEAKTALGASGSYVRTPHTWPTDLPVIKSDFGGAWEENST
jgi:hypothetical protein